MTLPLGELTGRYELIRPLGEGGMGAVHLARDRYLDRLVAIKTVHTAKLTDPVEGESSLRRFHREARIIASLTHPNILPIYDTSAPQAEKAFIVTEYIDGRTLRALVPDSGLSNHASAAVLEPILSALAYAHDRRVVHRDIKPENVMVDRQGRLRLLDFGLSRMVESLDSPSTQLSTVVGKVSGTVPYMSPEQTRGERVDHRSDLFTMGILAYELSTGVRPFVGPTTWAILYAIQKCAYEPPRELRPDLDPSLCELIARCLRFEPAERPDSAAALARSLQPLLREHDARTVRRLVAAGASESVGSLDTLATPDPQAVTEVQTLATAAPTIRDIAPHTATADGRIDAPPLLGRDDELTWMTAIIDEVTSRSKARIVWIEGGAGVGKSALCDALRHRFQERGRCHTSAGRVPSSGAQPMAGLVVALDDLLGVHAEERDGVRRALDGFVTASGGPHWADEIIELMRPSLSEGSSDQLARLLAANTLASALVRFFLRVALDAPLMLILDDLHHIDEATAGFLATLARTVSLRDAPVLVLATVETAAAGRNPHLRRCRADLERLAAGAFRTRSLACLDAGDTAKLIRAVSDDADPTEAERIHELSGGNPMLTLQIVRHALDSGQGVTASSLVSRGVSQFVEIELESAERRSRCPDSWRAILARCGMIGQLVSCDVLETLLEIEGSAPLLRDLDPVLDSLVTEGILANTAPDGETLRFRAGVYREVALQAAGGGLDPGDASTRTSPEPWSAYTAPDWLP